MEFFERMGDAIEYGGGGGWDTPSSLLSLSRTSFLSEWRTSSPSFSTVPYSVLPNFFFLHTGGMMYTCDHKHTNKQDILMEKPCSWTKTSSIFFCSDVSDRGRGGWSVSIYLSRFFCCLSYLQNFLSFLYTRVVDPYLPGCLTPMLYSFFMCLCVKTNLHVLYFEPKRNI